MRPEPNMIADKHRRNDSPLGPSPTGSNMGFFRLDDLRIVSSGAKDEGCRGWEHVSVSLPHRCPTWSEMCRVKALFWGDDEAVIQFHPPKRDYINRHPYCLHLWKQVGVNANLPPRELIG